MTDQTEQQEIASALMLRRAVEKGVSGLDQTTREAVERLSSQGGTLLEILSLLEGTDKETGADPMQEALDAIVEGITSLGNRLHRVEQALGLEE